MRVMVTGCAGFIGSHLTESLLADGFEVLGIDCFNSNYARADKLENLRRARDFDAFDFVPVDLGRGDLADLVADVEVVYHLAGEPGVRSSWGGTFSTYLHNNVLATQQLLEALKGWPGKRLVNASSSSVYGDAERLPTGEDVLPRPFSPYGVTKLAAEQLATLYHGNFDVPTVSLRYFSVYGPRQRPDMGINKFCRAVIEDRPILVFGDGTQTRDFTYVADIVAATRAAADSEAAVGNVYNVGGGSRVSVNEIIALLQDHTGRAIKTEHRPVQDGDVQDTGSDSSRAARDLGFSPKTPVHQGVIAEFEWLSEELRHSRRQLIPA